MGGKLTGYQQRRCGAAKDLVMSPLRAFSLFESVDQFDEEETFADAAGEPTEFDKVVGAIGDIVVGESFQELQRELLEKYHQHFDSSEENKLIYTEIFETYTTRIEQFIEAKLATRFENFSMETFLQDLRTQGESLDGDIFELLFTLSDFLAFK